MKKIIAIICSILMLITIGTPVYALDGPADADEEVDEQYNNPHPDYVSIANDESLPKHINVDQKPSFLMGTRSTYAYVTEQAWATDGITQYKQGDYNDIMNGSCTIASHGCTITSVAMVLSKYGIYKNPSQLNSDIKSRSGYDGCSLNWNVLTQLYGITATPWSNGPNFLESVGMDTIEGALKTGNPILVGIHLLGSTSTHWVVCYGYEHYSDGGEFHYIFNPGSENYTTLEQYMNSWYIEHFATLSW